MKEIGRPLIIFIVAASTFAAVLYFVGQQIISMERSTNDFPLEKQWSYCVGEKIRELSAGGDNTILVKTDNSMSAYALETAQLVWTTSIKKQVQSFPPVAADERVFVSDNEQLFAFDLITGGLLWKVSLDGRSTWIPAATDRFVLLNTVSDRIRVFEADTGTQVLEFPAGRGFTPAFVVDDVIYIIDRGIKALDISTGNLIWQVNHNRVTGLGTYDNGVLYFIEYPDSQTYDLVAYSVELHVELWRENFSDDSPNGIYIHGGILVLPENSDLHGIDLKSGKTIWTVTLSDPTNVAFIEDSVYVLEQFRRVIHAIDTESGKELASLQISLPQAFGTRTQEMIAVDSSIVFSRGCEIYVYKQRLE